MVWKTVVNGSVTFGMLCKMHNDVMTAMIWSVETSGEKAHQLVVWLGNSYNFNIQEDGCIVTMAAK